MIDYYSFVSKIFPSGQLSNFQLEFLIFHVQCSAKLTHSVKTEHSSLPFNGVDSEAVQTVDVMVNRLFPGSFKSEVKGFVW